ncbi:MAG: sec-independent protein translocase TatC [Nitrospinae bacterium CG11_big_fil_rev_8_21_14_0_20_45_15]|nr:MAG: sec-independent protein translocase TatC [Nitrospinae bacterium CG11_big_fil_rev_8_21_14_0_20_45_15]
MRDAEVLARQKGDIRSEENIRWMVDSFYSKARDDDLIGPIFDEAISDWEKHLPTMYRFWGRLLLGVENYYGNPLQKHFPLPLDQTHFSRWIELFVSTIDENFSGPKAEAAKKLAQNIAGTFQLRLGICTESDEWIKPGRILEK